MAEGGHKGEYSYPDNEDDLEWWAETRMNIRDVRSLYSSIDYYQSIWPGEPDAALRSMNVDAKATTMDANIVKPKGGEI